MTPEQLADEVLRLGGGGYRETKVLADGSVAAIGDLLFTRAIFLGCSEWGFARRFCFEDRALADQRFKELASEDDEPTGFTARR
jgi:hypothetical protein